jgi:hypothetical protein
MQLKTDQEFKNLIRPLTYDERKGLKENLIENGCLDSIKTWDGFIVDGHNRYDICNECDIDFRTDELTFNDRSDVKIWMIRQQLDKRNVNDYIRTVLALKMEDIFKEKARENMVLASHPKQHTDVASTTLPKQPLNKIDTVDTRKEIAKTADVSEGTVAKVKFIEDKATEEQKEDLAGNKKSIHKVYTELKDQYEPKPEKPKEEREDPDHCMYTPFIPTKAQVSICPCGCGYGYCMTNDTWYKPNEILQLEGEQS